jgi:hypothetical protein
VLLSPLFRFFSVTQDSISTTVTVSGAIASLQPHTVLYNFKFDDTQRRRHAGRMSQYCAPV